MPTGLADSLLSVTRVQSSTTCGPRYGEKCLCFRDMSEKKLLSLQLRTP